MGDIFDQIAADTFAGSDAAPLASGGGDIFDQIAASAFQDEQPEPPSFLESVGSGVVKTPRGLYESVKAVPSGIGSLLRSIVSPVKSVNDGTTEGVLRGGGALAAGTAGAGTGATFGTALGAALAPFTLGLSVPVGAIGGAAVGGAAGLLGFDYLNRGLAPDAPNAWDAASPEQDIQNLGENIGMGLTLGVAAKGAEAIATRLPKTGQALDRKSLGTYASDYGRASETRTIETPEGGVETFTKSALDDLLDEGALGISRNPEKLMKVIEKKQSALGQSVDDAIAAADNARTAPAVPEFDSAMDYIVSGKVPGDLIDSYVKRLDKIDKGIASEGKGSLAYLQQQKVAFGKSYDTNDAVLAGFNRAIYDDLKKTIEAHAPEVGPLNAELSKYMVAEPIVRRSLKQAENRSFLNTIADIGFTTGGIGAPTIAGSYLGGPVGAVIGGGIGLTGRLLKTKIVQSALGRALKGAGVVGESGAISSPELLGALEAAAASRQTDQKNTPGLGADLSLLGQLHRQDTQEPQSAPTSPALKSLGSDPNPSLNPTSGPSANQPSSNTELSKALNILKPKGERIPASVKQEIAGDPYLHALALTESSMNPEAKNPKSSAKGLFQFVDSTARSLGLSNAMDPAESLAAVKKLTSQIDKIAKGDPALRYAGHYLGESLLKKVLDGKPLTAKEAAIVESFKTEALPNFKRNFEMVSA